MCVFMVLLATIGWRAWERSRVTPEQRERHRRARLLATGKMGDADLIDVHDNLLVYTYAVRGAEYTASQDISSLRQSLPERMALMAGPVYMKYDPRNPADSIVLAEEWSGLQPYARSAIAGRQLLTAADLIRIIKSFS